MLNLYFHCGSKNQLKVKGETRGYVLAIISTVSFVIAANLKMLCSYNNTLKCQYLNCFLKLFENCLQFIGFLHCTLSLFTTDFIYLFCKLYCDSAQQMTSRLRSMFLSSVHVHWDTTWLYLLLLKHINIKDKIF